MHLRKRLTGALLALFLLLMPALALADSAENLIINPEVDGLTAWNADAWDSSDGMSRHMLADIGYDDGTSLFVENIEDNDARFTQTVWVEPGTAYRISCYVMAEDLPEMGGGANISIDGIYVSSPAVYDTQGEWTRLELYGETGPDQTELRLMARVGNYGAVTTGRAWFDHFEMVPVDDLPEGVMLADFSTPAPAAEEEAEDPDMPPVRHTETLLLIAALFTLLTCAGWSTIRRLNEGDPALRGHGEGRILTALLAAAFLLRIYLAIRYPGYRVDMSCFRAWGQRMLSMGPFHFYDPANYFCDYPPLYLVLLSFAEAARSLLGIAANGTLHGIFVRIWPILCDILTAVLIYRVGRKHIGKTSAAALATLHGFNIAGMAISAAWGQADSVLTLLLALSLLLTVERKWTPALVCYALSVLTKPQALLFAPVGVTFFICDIVREPKRRLKLLLSAGIGIGAACLALLPFSVGLYDGMLMKLISPVRFLIELFTGTTGGYSYMTVNALNLYCLLDMNWSATDLHPVLTAVAWALMFAGITYGCVLTALSKDRRNVLLTSALVISLIFAFGPMMHERYLYPCIVLLTLFYAMGRDRRVLLSAIFCTATLFLNTTLVLQGGMGAGNYGHLDSSEQMWNALISLANVLNSLFLAYTAFRICVQRQLSTHEDRPCTGEPPEGRRLRKPKDARLHLTKRDWALMLLLTGVYAVVAFVNLGTTAAPQTEWTSTEADEAVVFDLGETQPFRMMYYGGICNTHFTVALSDDGRTWSEDFAAEYSQGDIFRWLYYVPGEYESGQFSDAFGENEIIDGAPKTRFSGDLLPDGLAEFAYSDRYPPQQARFVRITAVDSGMKLREVGFVDASGTPLPVKEIRIHPASAETTDDAAKLTDEQDTIPDRPSYYNGTYFDEIYHARTAYEHQQRMNAYEWTHPPLGKVLIMAGIEIFGMTPFGWRFTGTLIGVLMLPLMYLLAKQLTHRTDISFISAALMALDSMHFTQTRIATVDSFGVFFIMLMYLFMFRYQQMNWNHNGLKRTLIPLGLCGISMGLGIAAKWIGVYAGIGLAVIFFTTLWKRFAEHRYALRNEPAPDADLLRIARREWVWLVAMIIGTFCCLGALITGVIPQSGLIMETLHYPDANACMVASSVLLFIGGLGFIAAAALYAHGRRAAESLHASPVLRAQTGFWRNAIVTCLFCILFFIVIPLLIYYFSYYWQLRGEAAGLNIDRVVDLQESMFSYHAGLGDDDHYFRSEWYEWPIIWWPMWYYSGNAFMPEGVISSISCMGNPAVWWTGLGCLIAVLVLLAVKKRKPDSYHLVIIGFLSQFLPWVLVPRSTFIYHYFASVPFIILCTGLILDRIRIRSRKRFILCTTVLLAAALVLFVMFYPLESGMPVARSYAQLLRWFKWYNF